MKKQNSKTESTPAIRPVAEMSEKQILAEKFRKQVTMQAGAYIPEKPKARSDALVRRLCVRSDNSCG